MTDITTPFPDDVAYGFSGGAGWLTRIHELASGLEQRNISRTREKGEWRATHRHKTLAATRTLQAYHRVARGRAYNFPFLDHLDYQVTTAEGRLGATGQTGVFVAAAVGNGLPTYQLAKRYSATPLTLDREIKLPGTATVYRNALAVTQGAGAGEIAIDTALGIVTFVADATSNASSITPGATTQVVLAADMGLVAGRLLYLTGFAGADAALVNGLAHTINSVTGAGPYTFTLATNTSGKTITLGSGQGRKYPQPVDALTWSTAKFYVPARFDMDRPNFEVVTRGPGNEIMCTWGDIGIVEDLI